MSALTSNMLVALMLVSSLAVSAAEGDINSDLTWDTDRSHTGSITVTAGSSLTIEGAEVKMGLGSTIRVEEGGSLTIRDSQIVASSPPTGIVGFGYGPGERASSFMIPAGSYFEDFYVHLIPANDSSFFGLEFLLDGSDSIYGTNDGATIQFAGGDSDTWITVIGLPSSSVGIREIELEFDDGTTEILVPTDLKTKNMRPFGSSGFSIVSDGTVEIIESSIIGGTWQIDGFASISNTSFNRSSPLIVQSPSSSLSIANSTIGWSLEDHDVRLGPSTEFTFEEVDWSDGLTDRWERRVGPQKVEFASSEVDYIVHGLGPTMSSLGVQSTDQFGVGVVGQGIERTVEIGWSETSQEFAISPVWAEEAYLSTESYRTAWNPSGGGLEYGGVVNIDWNKTTLDASRGSSDVVTWSEPFIEFDQIIDYESLSADPNSGWLANVTIINSGNAAAFVYFVCNDMDSGMRQSIGDSYVGGLVESNSESTFPIIWTPVNEGYFSLVCEIITPSQLVDETKWGGGTLSGPYVTFEDQPDTGSGSVLPALIVIGVAILGFGWYMIRRLRST